MARIVAFGTILVINKTESKTENLFNYFRNMGKNIFNGENSGTATANETYKVYYVSREAGYATYYEHIIFKSKANADTFIALMKEEGYKISDIFGGYIG